MRLLFCLGSLLVGCCANLCAFSLWVEAFPGETTVGIAVAHIAKVAVANASLPSKTK